MQLKNKKGFSLTELLIVLAIMGMMAPLLFSVFVAGVQDYSTTTKYLDEQYTVMEVTRLIRQDVEEAKKISFVKNAAGNAIVEVIFDFPDTSTPSGLVPRASKRWKFDTDGLQLKVGAGSPVVVIDDLDLTKSYFAVDKIPTPTNPDSLPTRLILAIKPKELNNTKFRGRNVNEKVITEFSVRYKDIPPF